MKRLALATSFLLLGSAVAMADPCEVNPSTPSYSPGDDAISIIFDSFLAFPGNLADCQLSVPAHYNTPNDPDLFEVYSATYKGFVDDGDTATITVEQQGFTDSAQVPGPIETTDTYFETFAGKDGDGNIVTNTTLELPSGAATGIDTLDYALLATMTRGDAEDSVDQIGLGQVGLVTHLDQQANLLTSGNLALEGADEFGFIGGVGSFTLGANARYNIADGVSILGGVSLVDLSAGNMGATGVLGAAAIRYVQPDAGSFRLFGEGGVQVAGLGMSFSRTYTDSIDTHHVSGSGTGLLGAGYVRGGVLFAPDENNEIVLSATLKQSVLGITSYSEIVSANNLFAADLTGTNSGFTTVKLGVDWTTQISSDVDLTASAALGSTAANQGSQAYIFGGGDVVGTTQSALFAEYGLRLGWDMTPDSRLDGYVSGSTGVGIGTHAQIGAGYHQSF